MSNKVPQIRFNGYSDDWEERKLGEFTTSFSGGTPSAGNSSYYKGDIPFIRSGEIKSFKIVRLLFFFATTRIEVLIYSR
ncbi:MULTISPECIES: restriction endonuclease subunit S [Lactobacillaceae]|uniref:restriction endonuclease subunit S n=1 Tax=Lactobacillaceae TaxID=33958 RepID=UPI0004822F40|nr:hypothetical protein NT96_05370 [Oenococcus kitaharae]OEY83879.1 hypothetical protein NT95_03210 [Oenococcus kitaharae]OEY84156.1 hypothetical protein NV75_04670 [Oenococcus kitaharae]